MTSGRQTPSIGFREPIRLVEGLLQTTPKSGLLAILVLTSLSVAAQNGLRQIGQFRLPIVGISAKVDQANPVVPKNVASGVHVTVTSGTTTLTAAQVTQYLGGAFQIQGSLTGPGLAQPVSLPTLPSSDPFLLLIPAVNIAGNYQLSNLRLVVNGTSALDVSPSAITIQVVDQVLITSVQTTPLTIDQIKALGIVLDGNAYQGFQFTLGLLLESQVVPFSFPVVFDQNGVAFPLPITPPSSPGLQLVSLNLPSPTMMPVLLQGATEKLPMMTMPDGTQAPITIPGLIVIPGNVGYLKQFFTADLYVGNGAPAGSGLTVQSISGSIQLPPGADGVVGTSDDPLSLPATVNGPQSATLPVLAPDSSGTLNPGDQGKAEWLVRGDQEGFYKIGFNNSATLNGLVTGPVQLTATASGGVLVRNPYFDMTFSVPSVVRQGQAFSVQVTVTNISLVPANNLTVSLNVGQLSGAHLVGDATQGIRTLGPNNAVTLTYQFQADRSGKVVATYLHFDTQDGTTGQLNFTLAVDDRGVPLSPDTLVLPDSVDNLPADLVNAAMTVLGDAWSVANTPAGQLPPGVIRISKSVVTQKALDLAEAGLRVTLGQPTADAIRDLIPDFYGGSPIDAGFDQLLRQSSPGFGLATSLGLQLAQPVEAAGGPLAYIAQYSQIAASGPDFIALAVASGSNAAPVRFDLTDRNGLDLNSSTTDIPGAVLLPLAAVPPAPLIGMLMAPSGSPYTLALVGTTGGSVDLSVAVPTGNGSFLLGTVTGVPVAAGERTKIVIDLSNPTNLVLLQDTNNDGSFSTRTPLTTQQITAQGATLLSATVIGPETIPGASPLGFHVAALFDRVVDPDSAATTSNYQIPSNSVQAAMSQLSGRMVIADLAQPEGPYVPATFSASSISDGRGVQGPSVTVPLQSRLQDPGAVVSGHVLNADGTPVTSGAVTYINYGPISDCDPLLGLPQPSGFAATQLSETGAYQFHYVRQADCGLPFSVAIKDPNTGALNQVTDYVRNPGQQLILDIVFFGRGSVTGVVRDIRGNPVAGAQVVAVSVTNPQVGGAAITDGSGRYTITGITVGQVTVTAASGTGLGMNSGRISRTGTAAQVDITLDSGSASVSGHIYKFENGSPTVVPGIQVLYYLQIGSGSFPVGITTTALDGSYSLGQMPAGAFTVEAFLDAAHHASVSGVTSVGDSLQGEDLYITISPDSSLGTVSGTVRLPNGNPAPGSLVSIGQQGVLAAADGTYQIPGVSVIPYVAQTVSATSSYGQRTGQTTAVVNTPGQVVTGVDITLSGEGTAVFTILDPKGRPLAGQIVGLLNANCGSACGCRPQTSDSIGKATFSGVGLGAAHAHAVLVANGYTDVADGSAMILTDGGVASGQMQFKGAGTVTGLIRDPSGNPVFGATVALYSNLFNSESCSLVQTASQSTQTDQEGHFAFAGVNVGEVVVTATDPFYPSPISANGILAHDGDTLNLTASFSNLQNTTSGILSGTVYLPDGVTPAGAGIQVTANGALPDVVVSTDSQSHFAFAAIFPEGTYSLSAIDPVSGGRVMDRVYLRAGMDTVHDLRLKGTAVVNVHVVDAAGQPVTAAQVHLRENSYPYEDLSGVIQASDQGIYTFTEVFEGPLSVDSTDVYGRSGSVSANLPQGVGSIDVTVTLRVSGVVQGHFYQRDGVTPIGNALVTVTEAGRPIAQVTTPATGDVGSYSMTYVPAGPVSIFAQDPNTARTGMAQGTITSQGQVLTLDTVAQGIGSVQGTVTSNGSPQAGAQVDIYSSGSYHVSTLSDANGFYLVSGVPEGSVVVTASLAGGFLIGSASAPLIGDGTLLTLDVAMRGSGKLTGQVFAADGVTPAPPSVVTVTVGGPGGGTISQATDPQGAFSIEHIPAGSANVSVNVINSIDQGTATIDIPANGAANATVILNGVGSIFGVALDSSGQPTSGTVVIQGTGAFPYTLNLAIGNDGALNLPAVLAGPFRAQLTTGPPLPLVGTAWGSVTPNQVTNLQLQVQPSGTITGLVLHPDGSTPAIAAAVTVQTPEGPVLVETQTDGTFTVQGVPLGSFSILIYDSFTNGYGMVSAGSITSNGQVVNIGTVVLDNTTLAVVSTTPAAGSINVPTNQPITIVFNDAIAGLNGIYLTGKNGSIAYNVTISQDGKTVTLQAVLPDESEISIGMSSQMTNIFGQPIGQPFTATFQTVDLTPPSVIAISPANQAFQVSVNAQFTATFSETLNSSTDFTSLFAVTGPGGLVAGTAVQSTSTTAVFSPTSSLQPNSNYTIVINGAIDLAGNKQTVSFTSLFYTIDTIPPVLQLVSPQPGTWVDVARPSITISTSDALTGVNPPTATLAIDGQPVTPQTNSNSILFTPSVDLVDGSHRITASVSDFAGNVGTLSANFSIDTIPPSAAQMTGITEGERLSGTVTIGATATDSGSGVARIDLLLDGTTLVSLVAPNFSTSIDTTQIAAGSHLFAGRAVDQAGNVGPVGAAIDVIVANGVIISVTPATGPPGAQNLTVGLQGRLTNWVQGTTTADFGAGIRVASLTVNSSISATVVLNIDLAAATGPRTVSLTTGSEIESLPSGFAVSASTCVAPPSGLVGWWPGDGNAKDIVGGHDGTLAGGVTFATGMVGQAFSLDGVAGNIVVALSSPSSLDIPGPLTVDAWIRLSSLVGTDQYVVIKDSGTGIGIYHNYQLWIDSLGQVNFDIGTGTSQYILHSSTRLAVGTWYHIAGVYDGSNEIIYINGVEDAVNSIGSQTLYTDSTAPLRIGIVSEHGNFDSPFGGLIDEVEVFNRGLFSSEIQAIYNAGSVGECKGQAAINSVAPNTGQQGQQNLSVAITGQFTNWAQGTTTADFGAGITVVSLTVNSATSATAVLDIDSSAALGTRTITLTTGSEIDTLANGFAVTGISCMAPPLGLVSWWAGDGNPSDLLGVNDPSASNGVSFVPGEVGTGFTLGSGGYIEIPASPSLANQQFTWSAWARPDGPGTNNDFVGSWIVGQDVDNADLSVLLSWRASDNHFSFIFGNLSSEQIVSHDTFAPGQFYFVSATYDGATFTLYVNGQVEGARSVAKNIAYSSITWTIGASSANIRSQGYPRTWNGVIDEVQAFNRALSQSEILAIYVAAGTGECKEQPTISSITPNQGQQGQQNLSVTLTGQFTNWVQGTTKADFGAGITVVFLTVSSATSATAILGIDPQAAIGARTVTMTTGTEIATLNNGFTVTSGATLVSVTPNNGQQGQQNLSVTLSGQLTNWAQGTTTASFGAGITVVSVTVNSPTSATALLDIDLAAALGPRTVSLTTGTEIDTMINGFAVVQVTLGAGEAESLSFSVLNGVPGGHNNPSSGEIESLPFSVLNGVPGGHNNPSSGEIESLSFSVLNGVPGGHNNPSSGEIESLPFSVLNGVPGGHNNPSSGEAESLTFSVLNGTSMGHNNPSS